MSVTNTAVTTACDVREVLDRLGDRWSVPVLAELGQGGVRRYRELQRGVPGISQRMLTLTLRRLERDGLIDRTVYPTVPAQVEYGLTETGRSLTLLLHAVADWAAEHRESVMSSRARWHADHPDTSDA
ncbi:winged helix-turn-helix transcriptional regulator, partial [Nonomuraea zeae]